MKYLKLTNTEECLKLAECLINSKCYTDIGILDLSLDGYVLDGVHYCVDNGEADKNEFLLFDETHRNFTKHIIISLETMKLNAFKCIEHGIYVVYADEYDLRFNGTTPETGIPYLNGEGWSRLEWGVGDVDGISKHNFTKMISLDINRIENNKINGASIISIK